MGWPEPTVVISDAPPPVVQCRDAAEVAACDQLLSILRRGDDPILFVARKPTGAIEIHGRSGTFVSLSQAEQVMQEAKVKLLENLVRKKVPAFELVR